jgi:hypothetical protein
MGWLWSPRSILTVSIVISAGPQREPSIPGTSLRLGPQGHAALEQWDRAIANKSSIIYCSPQGGLGNTIVSAIASGILGLYFNKGIVCYRCHGEYFHFPSSPRAVPGCTTRFPDIPDLYKSSFSRDDSRSFEMWFFSPDHFLVHRQFGQFLFDAFGEYTVYYIGNHLFRVSTGIRRQIGKLMEQIPQNIITIGIHVRTHFGIAAFMRNTGRGCEVISSFIRAHFGERPYQLCMASDSGGAIASMKRQFPTLMQSGVWGFPDGDIGSAVVDFYFVQSCRELILTYRSTFSIMLSALANKTGYYYADEWDGLIRFTTSQLGMTSGVFQSTKPFNDKTCTLFHMLPDHEETLRTYYRYLLA